MNGGKGTNMRAGCSGPDTLLHVLYIILVAIVQYFFFIVAGNKNPKLLSLRGKKGILLYK